LKALVPKPRMNTCGEPRSSASTRTLGTYSETSARLAAPISWMRSPPTAVTDTGTRRALWRVFCAVTVTSSICCGPPCGDSAGSGSCGRNSGTVTVGIDSPASATGVSSAAPAGGLSCADTASANSSSAAGADR
jgi:hypothetical protein